MNEMIIGKVEAIQPDAIIVIGAGLLEIKEHIICSNQTRNNVDKAKNLLFQYSTYLPLVFSGGYTYYGITEAEAMYEYFINSIGKSVYHGDIYLEFQSQNNYDKIKYCLNLIQEQNWHNIIIIDQPMRLFQLKILVYKEIKRRKLNVRIDFVGAQPTWGENIQPQWRNPVVFVIYEILSTGYYIIC